MADVISQQELYLNAFNWEPQYTNRFIMYIADIPSYIVKAAQAPNMTNGQIVTDHINVDRKLKGKSRWNDISLTLYNPIVPSGAQSVMEWIRLHHESTTGVNGYSSDYKKDIRLNPLSGPGEIIGEWVIKGSYILDSNFGQYDWATEDAVMIELTISYDWALHSF